jgi:hypothetical protein
VKERKALRVELSHRHQIVKAIQLYQSTVSLTSNNINRSRKSFGLDQMATAKKATQNSLQDLIPLVNSTLPFFAFCC